jgi:GNAT superfamily N-acetyltransferase
MIGHYEALDREAGIELLRHALGVLAARHGGRLRRVLGPINGSTWMRYRLALPALPGDPSFDPPVFLGEPQNPFDYPEHFAVAGFTVAARYESRIDVDPARVAEGAEALARRVADLGVRITPLDLDRFDDELVDLHALSFEAFADNLYYSPLGRDEFFAGYRKMRPLIDSELVLMAREGGGALVAFQFAYLDPVSARDGRPTRAVIKTVATAPRVRGHGLAGHMLDLLRRRAHERGCQATIHALMHVGNVSTRMSARHEGQVFRRYALYQWLP